MGTPSDLGSDHLQRLLDVGRGLVSKHDPEAVLEQVLEAARELTGARYAALGVLDDDKRELARFLTVGIDDEQRQRIGPLPRGRGMLGELIRAPSPRCGSRGSAITPVPTDSRPSTRAWTPSSGSR